MMAQHVPRAPLGLLAPWLRIVPTLVCLALPAVAAPVRDPIGTTELSMHTRQALSDWCGSASFFVWLFAQTPQIYTNYRRKSVDGLSGVFVAQWMLGDVLNLIGSLLTHQLPFQIAVATYFCSIDFCILLQFIYYTKIYPRPGAPTPPSQQPAGRYGRRRRPRLSETGYGATNKSRSVQARTLAMGSEGANVQPGHEQVQPEIQQEPTMEEILNRDTEAAPQDEVSPLLPRHKGMMMGYKGDTGSAESSEEDEGEDDEPGRGRDMTRTAAIVASRHDRTDKVKPWSGTVVGRSQSASSSPSPWADGRMAHSQTLLPEPTPVVEPRSASAYPAARRPRVNSTNYTRARSRRRQNSRPSGPSTIVLLAVGILFTARSFSGNMPSASQPASLLGMTSSSDGAQSAWTLSSPTLHTEDQTLERVVGRISAWFCTILYMTSRLPQIWVNLTRRSVEGLSIMLFLSAFSGNSLYSASVLLNPLASGPNGKAYLLQSLPFLLGSGGTLIFDLIIVAQWMAWRGNEPRPIVYVQKTTRPSTSRRGSSVAPLLGAGTSRLPPASSEGEHRYARHRSRRRSLSQHSVSLPRSSSRPPLPMPSAGRSATFPPPLTTPNADNKSSA